MKPVNFPAILKKGKTVLLILLICLATPLSNNAEEKNNSTTGIQIPYEYENYDAIISGMAFKLENGSQITIKGSFYNNYWDAFCNINVYLTTIKKDGGKAKAKRFYLGDLLEGETGNYELGTDFSKELGGLELTFIYEICSIRHETPADFITITISWPPKQ